MSTTTTPKLVKYNVTSEDDEVQNVSVFFADGTNLVATASHPNLRSILEHLLDETRDHDETVLRELFDVGYAISARFEAVGERVAIKGGTVYLDMDPLDGELADTIVAYYREGNENFSPLVKFLEKVASNPMEHSRKQLYRWLASKGFGITEDGDIIGYKGVTKRRDGEEATYYSKNQGTAIVNGVEYRNQLIPTTPHSIVEMPRSAVDHDPRQACSTGLHVGTFRYASGWAGGGVVLRVKINPRDAVSVPNHEAEKMRVCRYHVLDEATGPNEGLLVQVEAKILAAAEIPAPEPVKLSGVPAKKLISKPPKAPPRGRGRKPAKKEPKRQPGQSRPKPRYYEDFRKPDFAELPYNELRWLASQWEVKAGANPKAATLVSKLARKATSIRRANSKHSPRSKKVQRTPFKKES